LSGVRQKFLLLTGRNANYLLQFFEEEDMAIGGIGPDGTTGPITQAPPASRGDAGSFQAALDKEIANMVGRGLVNDQQVKDQVFNFLKEALDEGSNE
jgi:hypothetical protein